MCAICKSFHCGFRGVRISWARDGPVKRAIGGQDLAALKSFKISVMRGSYQLQLFCNNQLIPSYD